MKCPLVRPSWIAALVAIAVVCATSEARGQAGTPPQPCRAVADTAAVPTPGQIRERRELRDRLEAMAKERGVAEPRGILFVDVDSTRRGKVFFIDGNLPQSTADEMIGLMRDYLSTLPVGKPYQALVRIDGDYPALAPGRVVCQPMVDDWNAMSEEMHRVLENHPAGDRRDRSKGRAVLRLVVNRDGGVSYVDVVQPTGDAYLDEHLIPVALKLRFVPAKLDGVPFDTRFRFNLVFPGTRTAGP